MEASLRPVGCSPPREGSAARGHAAVPATTMQNAIPPVLTVEASPLPASGLKAELR